MFLAFLLGLGAFALFILGFYVIFGVGPGYLDAHPYNHDGLLLVIMLGFVCWLAAVGLAAAAVNALNASIQSDD